jgi:hypothetical protein
LCDSYHCSADGILVAQSWRRRASQIVRYSGKPLMNRFKENNPDDAAFEQEVIDRHKNAAACETHPLHKMQWMGIASAFGLRSASYGGQVAPPILRANWDLSCEEATCRGRSVDQRTDEFTSRDVAFSTWLKASGQNLI